MNVLSPSRRVVVIGGVAGGASCAARLRRLDEFADITIVERGPDVSFANCGLPYHIGGEIRDRDALSIQTPASLQAMLNLRVLALTEATHIDRNARTVTVKSVKTGEERLLPYDQLVLAPGAAPLRPPLPGIEHPQILSLRSLEDMDRIKLALHHISSVLVIGAGFIGLEMAEQLAHLKKKVHLVELQPQILPLLDAEMVRPMENELRRHHVDLRLGQAVASFSAEPDNHVTAILSNGERLTVGAVILSIGVRPESALAKQAGLALTPRGHVVVSEYMQTSDPLIYAVGDVCATPDPLSGGVSNVPLGGPANRQGRTCADHMVRGPSALPYPGSIGTAIVRVFHLAAGITGLSEKRLRELARPYRSTTVTGSSHASYYPGSQKITLKVLWDPETGRVLGAQSYGGDGVDKRLDVLATALRGKLTIDDLVHLEMSYAPPFGSAKDIVNIAGFAATNQRDGLLHNVDTVPDGALLLDVRATATATQEPMAGATNIPLPLLRKQLASLDPNQVVVTVCNFGKTGYFAARVLAQHRYTALTLTGGVHGHPELLKHKDDDAS